MRTEISAYDVIILPNDNFLSQGHRTGVNIFCGPGAISFKFSLMTELVSGFWRSYVL
jgi:hypothetical protein